MLERKTSLALGVELVEGTALALANMAVVPINASPSITPDYGTTERMLATPDLTPRLAGEAFKSAQVQYEQELVAAASGPPEFDLSLRACGWRRWSSFRLPLGTITSGPVYPGQVFDQATSLVRGVVLSYAENGDSHIFVAVHPNDDPGDLTAADLVVVTASGTATVALTAGQDAGYTYTPHSMESSAVLLDGVTGGTQLISVGDTLSQVVAAGTWRGRVAWPWGAGSGYAFGDPTIAVPEVGLLFETYDGAPAMETDVSAADIVVVGTGITGQIVTDAILSQEDIPSLTARMNLDGLELALGGVRGTFNLRMRVGELPTFEFDMQGKGLPPADAAPGAFPENTLLPPPVLGSALQLGANAISPCWEEVSYQAGNDVALRTCPSDVTGYLSAVIGGRKPQCSMDPEALAEVVWPQFGNAYNMTPFRLVHALGADAGNRFQIEGWQAQTESATPAGRAGKVTADTTLNFTGFGDDELILHVY